MHPDGPTPGIQARPDPFVGKMLGGYKIVAPIGGGGMGMVYQAWQESMQRTVAIKVMKPALMAEPAILQRFQREAVTASRLNHPNIVTVHDFQVTADGTVFLVMDYLKGASLGDVIKKDGQITVNRCVHIFKQACDALEHAHKRGVLHRDLKPANIMLVNDDEHEDLVKVVDFGVAKILTPEGNAQKLTQTGEVFGSPVYMSPEQCVGEEIDTRSDIYALGITMYESLTGVLPLIGKDIFETIMKHKTEFPKPFGEVRPDLFIPDGLEGVIFHTLEKERENRPQSMLDLKDELESAVPAKPVTRTTGTSRRVTSDIGAVPKSPEGTPLKNSGQVTGSRRPGALNTGSRPRSTLPPRMAAQEESSGTNPMVIGAVVGGVVAIIVAGLVFASMHFGQQPKKDASAVTPPAVQTAPTAVEKVPATPIQKPQAVGAVEKPVKVEKPTAVIKPKVAKTLRKAPKKLQPSDSESADGIYVYGRKPRYANTNSTEYSGESVEEPTRKPVDDYDRWNKSKQHLQQLR